MDKESHTVGTRTNVWELLLQDYMCALECRCDVLPGYGAAVVGVDSAVVVQGCL